MRRIIYWAVTIIVLIVVGVLWGYMGLIIALLTTIAIGVLNNRQ